MIETGERTVSVSRFVRATLGAVLLSACAAAPPAPTPTVERVWPVPPDPPRVAYVKNLTGPEAGVKKKGFFARLFELVVGKDEAAAPRMIRPFGVFVGDSGDLLITDTGLQVVHRFDLDGGGYRQVFKMSGGRRLLSPTGVTEDRDGTLYVADSQLNRVVVFDRAGRFQREFVSDDDAVRISGIAYHPGRDLLYVSDAGGHRILMYARDGRKVGAFGQRGPEGGSFNFPTHLAVDRAGRLYVTDAMNFRVQVLEADGAWVRSIGQLGETLGSFSKPKGVGLDRRGHVYIVDGLYDTVQIFTADGDLLLNFGSAGTTEGAFWLPTGVAVDDQDRIYVADTYNARVQVFRLLDATMPKEPAADAAAVVGTPRGEP
jgi:DNA-binding beta-propeller fold protein YncE